MIRIARVSRFNCWIVLMTGGNERAAATIHTKAQLLKARRIRNRVRN